jgi:type II secretory pathway pseudopilin PulG
MMKKNRTNSRNACKGFTLLEALVAAALSSIVIFMLYSVFNTASKTYSGLSHRTEIYQNARIILDQISRTVKGATYYTTPAGSSCFFIFKGGASGWCNRSSGDELFFIAPWRANNSGQVSDLCEFGFYLDRGANAASDADNAVRMCIRTDASGALWNFSTVLNKNDWPANNINSYDELGFGVRSLTFEWYGAIVSSGAESWRNIAFDPNTNLTLRANLPRAIKIILRIVDPDDAKKYSGAALDPFTFEFSTIVYLINSKQI